jgi:hypothetical protein
MACMELWYGPQSVSTDGANLYVEMISYSTAAENNAGFLKDVETKNLCTRIVNAL